MKINIRLKGLLSAALISSLALGAASCGGGSGAPAPDQNTGPAAGFADLTGQLTQGSGSRPVSTIGSPLPGVITSLINAASGAVSGSDTTDSQGKFEIKNVPSGNGYLVKVEFTSSKDIDGDGNLDQVEMYFPISLMSQATGVLNQVISLDDSNSDGTDDSVEVTTQFSDDKGNHESHHHRMRQGGQSVEDSNGNGSFSDDSGFDDSNHDLLPDDSNHDGSPDDSVGSGGGFVSGELVGAIEALSASSITVAGVEFAITSATEFQVGTNHHASFSEFAVGDVVKIEGFAGSGGNFVATEVKDSAASVGDDSGEDIGDDNGGSGTEPGDDNGGSGTEPGDDNGGGSDDSGSGGDDSGGGNGGGGGSDDSGGDT